jgi:signal transduction histidine kinase
MSSHDPEPSHRRPEAGTENQPEYIRRLQSRLQQISRLASAGVRAQGAEDANTALSVLLDGARASLPDVGVYLLVQDGAGPRDLDIGASPSGQHDGERGDDRAVRDPGGVLSRAFREGRPIWASGEQADEPLVRGAIPVPGGDEGTYALVFESRRRPEDPAPEILTSLEALAHHAGMALQRSGADRQAGQCRTYLDTMVEVDREILGATRLDEVIRFALRIAVERVGAIWGAAWLYDSTEERLRLSSTFGGGFPEFDATLGRMGEQGQRALRAHGVVNGKDEETGAAFLCAPMIAFDEPLGALALVGRQGGRSFGADEEAFLRTLASQCALAIQNAHLGERERDAMRRVQETQAMLMQTERLAALGELSAKVAHEIRNPLSAIGGFARRIEKALPETDPNASYAAIIAREIRRLETILTEQLEFARAPRPRMVVIDMNEIVRETVMLVREETDRTGVQVMETYESRVPAMLLDADRVKQVVLNILKNAAASTRSGQRIRVRTRSAEGWAQVEIANDGERLSGEILEQLFVPFATGRNQGCGLGLAVADQIVKEHGGEIRVRSDEEWSVVFTVSFPIRQNQDKRRKQERRRGRDRRQAA